VVLLLIAIVIQLCLLRWWFKRRIP